MGCELGLRRRQNGRESFRIGVKVQITHLCFTHLHSSTIWTTRASYSADLYGPRSRGHGILAPMNSATPLRVSQRQWQLSLGFVMALAMAWPLKAQRPVFTGTWVRTDTTSATRTVATTGDAAFARGDMGIGWGSPLTIVQDNTRFIVTFDYFTNYDLQPKVRLAFALDGSESTNGVITGTAAAPTRSSATWQGATLVIATKFAAPAGVNLPAGALEVRQELTIDAQGQLTIRTIRHGGDGKPNVVTATYARR